MGHNVELNNWLLFNPGVKIVIVLATPYRKSNWIDRNYSFKVIYKIMPSGSVLHFTDPYIYL